MFENIRMSFKGIFAHKIRSFLTMLGIIIGIAAIISIVSTIQGTNEQIKNNIIGSGNNTVNVQLMQGTYPVDFSYEAPPENVRCITDAQKTRILDLSEVESCTVYRSRTSVENLFWGGVMIESAEVYGIDEDYFSTLGYTVVKGKGFSERDYSGFAKTAVIDETLAKGIFSDAEPVGQVIDLCGEPFVIIGVADKTNSFEPVINNVNDYYTYNEISSGKIFIPTESWCISFRYDEPQNCSAKAVDTDSMTSAGKKIADILNENITKTESDSEEGAVALTYKSESLLEQAKSLQDLSNSTNNMLIWIASISLLVGGIGVMNIMLVSVTERTREIGLKKALGARKRTILGQFLTEAAMLTSIGGIIGVGSGIGLSKVISQIAKVPVSISTPTIIVSVLFSMFVGIIFGLLPSIKAANLNPIDALRYE